MDERSPDYFFSVHESFVLLPRYQWHFTSFALEKGWHMQRSYFSDSNRKKNFYICAYEKALLKI